eukprot:gnl/MRDRNA2_/MRDRNA2_86108_c0_seq1.p1 gnl/MRDRNA2_/MRDRNA2_86108_c0~~gnl/MRDRNA2_/MRDRNA2_86108_c0_seq1.p1  ORF type:complete len:440 (-),score=15.33 gnl/MRDRNA2_/MRDRNA2_86108_c0_seq1:469-1734(-)
MAEQSCYFENGFMWKAKELIDIINCSFNPPATSKTEKTGRLQNKIEREFKQQSLCLVSKKDADTSFDSTKIKVDAKDGRVFIDDPYEYEDIRYHRSQILINRHHYITKILGTGAFSTVKERNSLSPPPMYNVETGQRINTREQRIQSELDLERRMCMSGALEINPEIKMPSTFHPIMKEVNIAIPEKDHPGCNFVGLILGRRGCTQKRLEYETGTKVTICSKGSFNEFKLEPYRDDSDKNFNDYYVHITADSWDKIDSAVELIEPLLIYIEEEKNIHKRKQMLQIAKNNGFLKCSWLVDHLENDKAGELMMIKQTSGPLGSDQRGIFQIPEHLKAMVEDQYMRDVNAVKGIKPVDLEDQFDKFMKALNYTSEMAGIDSYSTRNKSLIRDFHNRRQSSAGTLLKNFKNDTHLKSPYGGFSPC